MGIKGIYKEIGAGTRIAFMRLAVESLEQRGRPLRLAIDISIWQFQVQAAKGGSNPAIRTLFYRLVRLLGMPVQPVFVFDGLNKPLFKRNKRSGQGDGMATVMAKRMIRMFGFYVHDAPGEAEAECALLQQRGVVDAVLSEDVDTLMFGCTRTLRNWSAATTTSSGKGSTPATVTHVSMYETETEAAASTAPTAVMRTSETGLDREGLVLVALMSGGDYLPEGVPGCGVKLACEAAKAGFGRSLCRIKRADTAALAQWRANLQHELRTNESKFFRTCHHKLVIPEGFPNLDILRYYTHPVVSPAGVIERVREELAVDAAPTTARTLTAVQHRPIDVPGLREFVAETFDWGNRVGAIKFIRVLAPGLLARMLLLRRLYESEKDVRNDDLDNEVAAGDLELQPSIVEGISRQRTHASTDDIPEMRVSYIPVTVVGLDLEAELDIPESSFGRDGLALNSDDEFDESPLSMPPLTATGYTAGSLTVASARKATAGIPYDPTVPSVAWVPRALLQIGAPGALRDWEQRQQRGKKVVGAKAKDSTKTGPGRRHKLATSSENTGMQPGALDRFVQVTKNVGNGTVASSKPKIAKMPPPSLPATSKPKSGRPRNPGPEKEYGEKQQPTQEDLADHNLPAFTLKDADHAPLSPKPKHKEPQSRRRGGNPWTLSGSQTAPRVTKDTGTHTGSQQRKYTQSTAATTTPTKGAVRSRTAAPTPTGVIDLLSSSPALEAPSKTTSPFARSPSLPKASQSTQALANSSRSPTKRRNMAATETTRPTAKGLSSLDSPRKQTSIRSFLSSQSTTLPSQPLPPSTPPHRVTMTILVSDDEESEVEVDGLQQRQEKEPFSSSPHIFASQPKVAPGIKEKNATAARATATNTAAPVTKTKAEKTMTKKTTRYVPRTSAVGYFREEAVEECEEAGDYKHNARAGPHQERSQRGWRHSEIGVVDLTDIER